MGAAQIIRTNNWIGETNNWLLGKESEYRARTLALPADRTSTILFEKWRAYPHPCLNHLRLIQLDEIIEGERTGMFARQFCEQLPRWTVHPPHWSIVPDLVIAGMDVTTGHVALIEPGVPQTFTFGLVPLHEETTKKLGLRPGTYGLTYGPAMLLQAKAILLILLGEEKMRTFARAQAGDQSLPVSYFLDHPDFTVITDQAQ